MKTQEEIEKMFADMQLQKNEDRIQFQRFEKYEISEEQEVSVIYYCLNSSLSLDEVENAELARYQ